MRTLFLLAPIALVLSGCAAPTLYKWGDYDQGLYTSYKDASKTEALLTQLETHISSMEKSKQKIAPGLYAELGTLYLQSGSTAKAMAFYSQERDTWPESKFLMTAMIENLERREKAKTESQK